MPNLDQTGPNGQGAMTGCGRGNCSGNQMGQGRRQVCGNQMGQGKRQFCGNQNFNRRGLSLNNLSLDEEEKILENRLENIRKEKESNSNK